MAINYKQAKVFLRGMICLSEYEAKAIDYYCSNKPAEILIKELED